MSAMRRFLVAVAFAVIGFAPGTPQAATGLQFGDRVAGIFRTRCARCHGAGEAHNGLRLDSYDAVMRGAEDGPVVIAGNPRASLLMQKILRRDRPPMPPKKKLRRAEIRIIRKWIKSGARP